MILLAKSDDSFAWTEVSPPLIASWIHRIRKSDAQLLTYPEAEETVITKVIDYPTEFAPLLKGWIKDNYARGDWFQRGATIVAHDYRHFGRIELVFDSEMDATRVFHVLEPLIPKNYE